MTPQAVYWASCALMWLVTAAASICLGLWRTKLRKTTAQMQVRLDRDAPLAEWCRHVSITVVTHTGSVWSTTLAQLQASEIPNLRSWEAPKSVTLWTDCDLAQMILDVPGRKGPDDHD